MPFIEIMMVEGRTADEKRALLEAVSRATCETLGVPMPGIRTWIREVPRTDFLAGETLESTVREVSAR